MKNNVLVTISRLFVGSLFIFSGLIKANDPVGFAVKLEDYFLVFGEAIPFFGQEWFLNTSLAQAVFLVVLEVVLGVAVLLGVWMRPVATLLLLLIIFFTWLTGFSAITGKVQECGCFGDAIPLTAWQSFYKDLILLFFILVIFFNRKKIKSLLGEGMGALLVLIGTILTTWFAVHSVRHLPSRDFRPYKIGNNINDLMFIPEDAEGPEIQMIYKYKNKASGEVKEFVDTWPEDLDNWEFIDRTDKVIDEGFTPKISDFAIVNEDDVMANDEVLHYPDYLFWVISPNLNKTNRGAWTGVSEMQKLAEAEGIPVYGFVAATRPEIEDFRHENQLAFPFYTGDEKLVKTIIRTNPGIVLLKEGTIIDKWSFRDLPSFTEIKKSHFPERAPTEMPNTSVEIFMPGDNIPELIAAGTDWVQEFFVVDADHNDVTEVLLSDSTTSYNFIIRDIYDLSEDAFGDMLPLMQEAAGEGLQFNLITAAKPEEIAMMKEASGLDFPIYFGDIEILEKVSPSNTGMIEMQGGIIANKWQEGSMPAALSE